jgi:DNA-binding CsgD family transcriptional regulator/tetratricopeptide (TPR) repeat protein
MAPSKRVGSAAVPAPGDTTFVGRRAEFERLEAIWSAVEDDRRQVVFIGGEPGVGKTRLVAEAARALNEHGAAVFWGACQADFDIPYRPFVTILEQVLDDAQPGAIQNVTPQVAAPLLRLTASVRRHWPEFDEQPGGDRESRPVLFDALLRVLLAVAEERPAVLVLEDLHWAGEPTLAMLTHLVQSTSGERILVLITRRTTAPDRTDAVTYALADLYRLEGVERLDLGGLDTEDVTDYLVSEAGVTRSAARAVAPLLRDQTGGNPFFLHEYWQDLRARGGLDAVRSSSAPAPRSIQDALARRLAVVEHDRARVIEFAAVAGDLVDPSVIVKASGLDPQAALQGIDFGVRAGLLVADTHREDRYRFVHALARQAVLDRMSGSSRATAHASIAQALERPGLEADPSLVAELAHHYVQARALGYASKAVHYLVLAAHQAERSIAYGEAAALYERAAHLRIAEGPPRVELLSAAGRCYLHAGDFATARRLYEELARSDDPRVRLRAAIGYEDASWRPGVHGQPSYALLAEAVERAGLPPQDPLYVRALASMGRAAGFTGDAQQARDRGERALELARSSDDDQLLAHALGATLWQGMTPRLAPELLARATELYEIGAGLGDDDHLGPAAFYRAVFGYMVGDDAEWARAQRDLTELALSGGQPFFRYVAGCCRYAHRFSVGDFQGAEHITGWLDGFSAEFEGATDGSYGVQQFMLRRATGGLEQVRDLVDGSEGSGHHWLPGLLALYAALEMREPAARVLTHLCDRIDDYRPVTAQWAGVLAFMSEAAAQLDDAQAAARLRPLMAEYGGMNLVAGQFVAVYGSADRYIAELDSVLGAPSADMHFERALAMDRRMGAVTHQVETLAAWSRHRSRRNGTGGGPSAVGLADEARALARRIGHRRVLRDLDAEPSPAPAHHPQLPDGLTQRELDVLQLVAEGLSNREIGERLFITTNTAANHVRSILSKTHAPNRTTAAMYAIEHGLVSPPSAEPDAPGAGSTAGRRNHPERSRPTAPRSRRRADRP